MNKENYIEGEIIALQLWQ